LANETSATGGTTGSDPRISVVIPTRHRDGQLATCLEALRPQLEGARAEVIVSDDGTSGETRAMLERSFPFARWTQGPRRGPAANRNNGVAIARGELVVLVDDDVVPAPDFLANYVAAVSDDVDVYEGRTTCAAGVDSPLMHSPVNETGGYLWSCNLMLPRALFQALGGFDEDFPYPHLEDVAFRERLKGAGARVRFVPGAVVDHPPRPVASAQAVGRQHESYFLYCYRYLGRAPAKQVFFGDMLRHRVNLIAHKPLGRDSVVSLRDFVVEMAHVWRHWAEWDKKWRARAAKAG
jgi:GT2 family glycosyltransferase